MAQSQSISPRYFLLTKENVKNLWWRNPANTAFNKGEECSSISDKTDILTICNQVEHTKKYMSLLGWYSLTRHKLYLLMKNRFAKANIFVKSSYHIHKKMKAGEILLVMDVYGIDCGDGFKVHIFSKFIKLD